MSIHPIDSDFDWGADDSVVIPAQPSTAVYANRRGDVVIRQRGEDEEVFIYIRPENVPALCQALTTAVEQERGAVREAQEPDRKCLSTPLPPAKDGSVETP
jgi:hypothetical protein